MSDKQMSYEEAVEHYTEWAGQVGGIREQPSEAASELIGENWELANINGPLAEVGPDGCVYDHCRWIAETVDGDSCGCREGIWTYEGATLERLNAELLDSFGTEATRFYFERNGKEVKEYVLEAHPCQ